MLFRSFKGERMKRAGRILSIVLSIAMLTIVVEPVSATTISDWENQLNEHQNALNGINNNIYGLESEQEILEEEIADIDAEMINLMTSIQLLEDEIADKETSIAEAQSEYDAAVAKEQEQYETMKIRMQYMYEQGETDYFALLLESSSFAEMVNKADYIEQLYEYDRNQQIAYQELAAQVAEMRDNLIVEKEALEADKTDMQSQQASLDVILEKKKAESANYEAMLASAKAEAAAYKKKIKEDQKKIAQLQQAGSSTANNGSYTVTGFDTSIIDKATGSTTGKNIAKYGCQFIGNPYVYGGTSLTNGADCSGFIYRIYADFGYFMPRTSTALRSVGTEVSYSNAQPGDIVCYDGHVGLYCGGGYIVHASTPSSGIKISSATYRTILTVRRVVS